MDKPKITKYNDVDVYELLANLAMAVAKAVPDILFKQHDDYIDKHNHSKETYPKGVGYGFQVYHNSDPNNPIGVISVDSWYSTKPKNCIQSININDGRHLWGGQGQYKSSIHIKNIVRIAKKAFKPFTFEQIAKKHSREFINSIDSIRSSMLWQTRQNTCHDFELFAQDFYHLHSIGYKPINPKITKMIEYLIEHKEQIDKHLNYYPKYYFVLVKENQVQYCLNEATKSFSNPITVASKDELPEDIKGKLFVLDITDKKDFVEDVGLKENDGAYWIIA